MIEITLPDGSIKNVEEGTTALDIAKSISEGLARNVLAAEVAGEVVDPQRPITDSSSLKLLTWNDLEGKSTMWHSSAHLLAEALESMFDGIKFWVGPPIEFGFYYDVDFGEHTFTDAHIPDVEKKMLELAREKSPFIRNSMSKAEAISYFKEKGDEYKLDLLERLDDGTITTYTQGNFTDLCRGPHIPHTGFVKAAKITAIAGAYWKGDANNKQLTRVYAITFPKQKELTAYLEMVEQAKARDHRKLGKELDLFHFSERVGQGLPLWLPKGADLRSRLENFLKEAQRKSGYQPVITPHIGSKDLYVTSGHYAKYGEDSFQPIKTPSDGEEFLLKPMNCPHHCEMYNAKQWSYKELPVRYAEFGTVYRYEQSGELHGLTRVRGFTQDDAHIFCSQEQLNSEFKNVIDLVLYVFKSLGFENFKAQVSLRDPKNKDKYIGSDDNWKEAENAIVNATKEKGLNYKIEYGEAAFYGPKLDFMVKDALGREWQLGTIQVDYNLPERFDLTYVDKNNQSQRPVMIHRAPFGSLERFIAILIEHTGGNFPLWLTTNQVSIIPVGEKHKIYSEKVLKLLENDEIRATVDDRSETVGKKIRESELNKVPFMLIIGDEEVKDEIFPIRAHGGKDIGKMSIDDFTHFLKKKTIETIKDF